MALSQYIGQAEAEHAELLELRERINACLQVTEISNKEHNKKNSRIAALEAALREIAKLSDAERGGDIYAKMQKVNKHATAALGK